MKPLGPRLSPYVAGKIPEKQRLARGPCGEETAATAKLDAAWSEDPYGACCPPPVLVKEMDKGRLLSVSTDPLSRLRRLTVACLAEITPPNCTSSYSQRRIRRRVRRGRHLGRERCRGCGEMRTVPADAGEANGRKSVKKDGRSTKITKQRAAQTSSEAARTTRDERDKRGASQTRPLHSPLARTGRRASR